MDNKTEFLLSAILNELQLITVETKANAFKQFNEEFLTSELRREMYSAFDGEKTMQQISTDIACKINTLQVFAQTLIEKDLVDYEMQGNSRIIKKSISKIAIYYARKALEVING